MATYEYECQGCGHAFELTQKMTDKPSKKCPKCGKDKAKRLISGGAGVIFKGSGFYANDYKKGADKSASKCDAAGSKKACSSCPSANHKH